MLLRSHCTLSVLRLQFPIIPHVVQVQTCKSTQINGNTLGGNIFGIQLDLKAKDPAQHFRLSISQSKTTDITWLEE